MALRFSSSLVVPEIAGLSGIYYILHLDILFSKIAKSTHQKRGGQVGLQPSRRSLSKPYIQRLLELRSSTSSEAPLMAVSLMAVLPGCWLAR